VSATPSIDRALLATALPLAAGANRGHGRRPGHIPTRASWPTEKEERQEMFGIAADEAPTDIAADAGSFCRSAV
jgi:hypothetical protein